MAQLLLFTGSKVREKGVALLNIPRGWEMLSSCPVKARASLCVWNSCQWLLSQMVPEPPLQGCSSHLLSFLKPSVTQDILRCTPPNSLIPLLSGLGFSLLLVMRAPGLYRPEGGKRGRISSSCNWTRLLFLFP